MSHDIFVPTSKADDAMVQPLHTITYVTSDKAGVHTALTAGLELEAGSWFTPTAQELASLNPHLGFAPSATWEACAYNRKNDVANVQIRVIVVPESSPLIRPEIDGLYSGGLSIGFPMTEIREREKKMAELGISSSVGLKELEFTSPEGERYVSGEIHFLGPENVFLLGVQRPDVFIPVGPMDAATQIGAAAYSARCVSDCDGIMAFFSDVLGFEIRRDMTMTVGDKSGLRLPEGISERFAQLFAPGSSTGYLVFLDYEEHNLPSPAPTLGPPSRGVAMWSFPTRDIEQVYRNVKQSDAEIVYGPQMTASPFLPNTKSMLLLDPGGFPLEIFEV